jgi:hypothetical protein
MGFNRQAFKLVPEGVKSAARQVSEFLSSKGIPHAVIGGMAVSAYSPPRMTEDVDFLVPESALSEIREMGEVSALADSVDGVTLDMDGVTVDFIFMPDEMPDETLEGGPKIDGIPVLRPEALFLMKMHAPRAKDQADVIEMIKAGTVDIKAVKKYVKKHDPSMLDDLESNIAMADYEKKAPKKRAAMVSPRR